jgi:UDP-N-acetylmuramoyl-tripeptide--D-alanyl-D-alanine ligase
MISSRQSPIQSTIARTRPSIRWIVSSPHAIFGLDLENVTRILSETAREGAASRRGRVFPGPRLIHSAPRGNPTLVSDGLKHRLWGNTVTRGLLMAGLRSAAFTWRRFLGRTRFVAVTGSLGKTTTKELLARILSAHDRTRWTLENQNDGFGVPRSVLRVRPGDRFAVVEIGVGGPGQMEDRGRLVRPHVAVILGIYRTHSTAFSSLDQHAGEKSRLLNHLDGDGICVANGDDPRSEAIALRWSGERLLFGTAPEVDVVADRIEAQWPQRLRFRVRHKNAEHLVQTRLVGTHWVHSVLAALTTGVALGVPLDRSVEAVAACPPFPGRLQPVELPDGSVILRDDYNASQTVLEASFEVLRRASAARRILVLSDFSDYPGGRRRRLRHLAEQLPGVADLCLLAGESSDYGERRLLDCGFGKDRVAAFPTLREAAEALRRIRAPGDLVLLKGRTTDHVARVFFAQFGPIGCWRERCRKTVLCDFCPELTTAARSAQVRSDTPGEAIPGEMTYADRD